MILTISDSEEGILNKIKSVLACESTLEVMEITNSEKLTFQGLEIDQLQRSVIKDGKVVELTRHEYDLLFYLALSPNRVFTKEQIYQHIYEDVESEVDNRVYWKRNIIWYIDILIYIVSFLPTTQMRL